MWSPISVGTPPDTSTAGVIPPGGVRKTTEDLKDQMQAMIDLQVMQQQQYAAAPPVVVPLKKPLPTKEEPPPQQQQQQQPALHSPRYPAQDGVGRGTLLFSTPLLHQRQQQQQSPDTSPTMGSALSSSSPPLPLPPPPPRISPPPVVTTVQVTPPVSVKTRLLLPYGNNNSNNDDDAAAVPLSSSLSSYPVQQTVGHANLINYGATTTTTTTTSTTTAPVDRRLSSLSDDNNNNNNNNTNNPQTQSQPSEQQEPNQIYHMEGMPPHFHHELDRMEHATTAHQHDFHYSGSSPDYYYPDEQRGNGTTTRTRQGTLSRYCCCCLWYPLVSCLSNAELHRSACLGAIDGLVTGTSLLAALQGLDVWTAMATRGSGSGSSFTTNEDVRLWLVAVSTAVAVAEALCMAVGHVRTSQQGALHAWQGRQEVTLQVQTNRAAAKGHLVDLLLQRGLLKIDAMSIADTLEGYPDVCVSLLAGEGLEQQHASHHQHQHHYYAQHQHQHQQPDWHHYDELDDPEGNGSNSRVVKQAVAEAWMEAVGMMIGFGVAAIVPSLAVWLVLPAPMTTHEEYSYVTSSYHTVPDHHVSAATAFVEPTTLLLLTLSAVMMLLGWIKASLTSAPSYFGTIVEGVLLLLLGYGTAYGMGELLRGGLPDYLLTVATQAQSKVYCV